MSGQQPPKGGIAWSIGQEEGRRGERALEQEEEREVERGCKDGG